MTGLERRARRAFVFILLAGVLWAIQPVYLLIVGREFQNDTFGFLFWNYAGRAVLLCAIAGFFTNWRRIAPAVRTQARRRALFGTWLLDGLLIAASYLLLLTTPADANLLASAVLFETWPIVAAVILTWLAGKSDDRKLYALVAFVLFLSGFAGVVHFEMRSFWQTGAAPSGRALLSGILMGMAVAVVQRYLRANPYFMSIRQMAFFLLGRALVSLVALGLYMGVTGEAFFFADLSLYVPVLLFGMLVSFNSFLFHLGARNASSNVASLGVLISPTLAPVFLFLLGYGALTQSLLAGSACIFAGIAISARKTSVTPQFLIVALATILIGSVLVFVPGTASEAFLPVIEVLSIFYGLFQAAELSTLVSRYDRVASEASDYMFYRKQRDFTAARHRLRRVRTLQRDATAVSEIILLSFVGIAIVVLMIWLRPDDRVYDLLAYVIAVTIAYLLVISWVYLFRTANILRDASVASRKVLARMVAERLFSYLLIVVLLVWFLILLLLQDKIPL